MSGECAERMVKMTVQNCVVQLSVCCLENSVLVFSVAYRLCTSLC
jgi:hypothetical protein